MDGKGLLRLLIESTGLPYDRVEHEFKGLLEQRGFDADTLTLDQVRDVVADYLQTTLIDAKKNA